MALDMSKYAKMAKVERKLPIIFMINEKVLCTEKWDGGRFRTAIADVMSNLSHRSVDAIMSVVSFGEEIHLLSGFKEFEKYTEKEWPEKRTTGKSAFNIALMLVKDMLEDVDTTPEGNYDPIVVLISSDEASPVYKDELKELDKAGRFSNVQRIGIADLYRDGTYYAYHCTDDEQDRQNLINNKAPKILKEFAGDNIALYIEDVNCETWCTVEHGWDKVETHKGYTWFCPVLNMMELRYTENGQRNANPVCADEDEDVASIVRKNGVMGLFGIK